MNNEQKQQAKELYFQTQMTKTQIAEAIGVPRRTLHYWIRQNDWDRLRHSAKHLPALIAEQCYFIIAQLTNSLITEHRVMRPVTKQEADTLHVLALTINKLKNHATLNESMELFATFMGNLNKRSPDLAKEVAPFIDEYFKSRAGVHLHHLMPPEYNSMGFLPFKEKDWKEDGLDIQDSCAWSDDEDKPYTPEPPEKTE